MAASPTPEAVVEAQQTLSPTERRAVVGALGITEADIEHAQRAMKYVHCLYGTREPNKIAGLPSDKAAKPAFLQQRRAECAHDRSISEQAYFEQLSSDSSLGDKERHSKAIQLLNGFDYRFEENVLRPEVAEARRKSLQECLKIKGISDCLK